MHIRQLLLTVISTDTLAHGSGEDIVGEICDSMYGAPRTQLWESFELLPRVLQDVMLMIELDTELNMNGLAQRRTGAGTGIEVKPSRNNPPGAFHNELSGQTWHRH
ncbi:hypothetical protein [Paenibacillus massiliensis]|uniref:hypothetical protein n=1 Tax=Paenibacillus massiliensis TaxID=225917 RepID=UPI000470B94C|nr:hypothetical protein [Paenibacillus massiliensis]